MPTSVPTPVPTYPSFSAFAASIGAEAAGLEGVSAHRLEAMHAAPYVSAQFRTGYFSVVLVRTGRGRYWLDGTVYPTRAGTVYFTNPGHVKGFAFDEGITGRVLTFTANPACFTNCPVSFLRAARA